MTRLCTPFIDKTTLRVRCSVCGRVFPLGCDLNTRAQCKVPLKECPHFMGSSGLVMRMYGCGCSSEQTNGVEVTIGDCELHGLCCLWSKGGEPSNQEVTMCVGCKDNPNN